jgi:CubicO group peptidase (beta-lactamase class C family)
MLAGMPAMRLAAVLLVVGVGAGCTSGPPGTGFPARGSAAAVPADAVHTAEHLLGRWLEAFNTGDRAQLASTYAEIFVEPDDVDRELEFRRQTGGFELRRIESSTLDKVVALLKERKGDQFARAEVEIDPAMGGSRIRRFELRAVETPDEFRPPRLTEAAALDALRAELDRRVAADEFAGAVLIAKAGAPVFSQAYGLADREHETPNSVATRFRIGSMNKMFTATAIVQLAQAGTLKLDAPLATVLPDYPEATLAAKVTPHHLLTHTGGTGDIFTPEYDAKRLDVRTVDDYLALFGTRALGFEPGAQWAYSNYGFVLLGAVIERLTKQSYYDALQAAVFGPAGMTSTSSPPEDQPMAGRSISYTRGDGGGAWTNAAATLPYRGSPAGGGDSTVTDLLAFANALAAGTLLDAAHVQLLTTKQPGTGDRDYAYGFVDRTVGGLRCVGHGGGAPGMNGELLICDNGYTIAVLANLDPPAASTIAGFIRDRLPAE